MTTGRHGTDWEAIAKDLELEAQTLRDRIAMFQGESIEAVVRKRMRHLEPTLRHQIDVLHAQIRNAERARNEELMLTILERDQARRAAKAAIRQLRQLKEKVAEVIGLSLPSKDKSKRSGLRLVKKAQ